MTVRLGWFTTARGPGSRGMFEAVISALQRGDLTGAELAFVFCNRGPGEDPVTDGFFARVDELGIPLITTSSVRYRRSVRGERSRPGHPLPAWRYTYDREVEAAIAPYRFDLGVLAGYMLIFADEFSTRHPLLNLHPALPDGPSGTWREVIRQLIRERAPESGVMLHLAIPAVDEGPVVAFCRYPIRGPAFDVCWRDIDGRIETLTDDDLESTPLFTQIRAAGLRRESPLLVATLAAFADGRLRVDGGRLVDPTGASAPPADLTADVEDIISSG